MIRSLFSGVSGIRNHQVRMDVIANNISNVNTNGFKSGRPSFMDTLSQTIKGAGVGRNPAQAGTGINLAGVGTNMGQGPLQMTGRTLDLAISGNGFFQVRQNIGAEEVELGEATYYTRDGNFFIDNNGFLCNSAGYYLVSGDAPIQVSQDGEPVSTINIDQQGMVMVNGENVAQITLASFSNPEGLMKKGLNLFEASTASGEALVGNPGADGFGTVEAGYLEMSNADLSEEFTSMITTQRGYQASARIITVSDTLLQELIDLKR